MDQLGRCYMVILNYMGFPVKPVPKKSVTGGILVAFDLCFMPHIEEFNTEFD